MNMVVGIGLGQFGSSSRLSSLHSSFLAFFVPLARSLGYIVVGVNEYYTSKKCPHCHTFVFQVSTRGLFCEDCGTPFHRDEMAGHNMVNVVQGHLLHQKRPLYLQPVDENGHYPWMETEITRDAKDSMDTENTGVAEDKDSQALEETNSSSINDCTPRTPKAAPVRRPRGRHPRGRHPGGRRQWRRNSLRPPRNASGHTLASNSNS
ncbi:hypothetical protein BGX26_004962 [Mortierella sp. AD094]|nr:hypothetical protein BGX26_004962 [Mortierella sp. AD094]